jgi:hypothetical protein
MEPNSGRSDVDVIIENDDDDLNSSVSHFMSSTLYAIASL